MKRHGLSAVLRLKPLHLVSVWQRLVGRNPNRTASRPSEQPTGHHISSHIVLAVRAGGATGKTVAAGPRRIAA